MSLYTAGTFSFFDAVPAATTVALQSVSGTTNADVSGSGSGSIYEEQLSLTQFLPEYDLSTKDLTTVLGSIALDGQCVGTGQLVTKCEIVSRVLNSCKESVSATPHEKHTIVAGLLNLKSLSASRGSDATVSWGLQAITDGTNAPVATTDGVALPSSVTPSRFRLGLCKIAGILFPEMESISLDFGNNTIAQSPANGLIWSDRAGTLTVRPVLSITDKDLGKIKAAEIALGATSATHANTLIQLKKLKSGASYESDGSTVHITLTVDGLAYPESIIESSQGEEATWTLRVPLRHDGTLVPVVANLAAIYDPTP